MLEKNYKITSENGLHVRPATKLVEIANEFNCDTNLSLGKATVNCKSIMGVMSLGAYHGEVIKICCNGVDEVEAMEKLSFAIMDMKLGKEV